MIFLRRRFSPEHTNSNGERFCGTHAAFFILYHPFRFPPSFVFILFLYYVNSNTLRCHETERVEILLTYFCSEIFSLFLHSVEVVLLNFRLLSGKMKTIVEFSAFNVWQAYLIKRLNYITLLVPNLKRNFFFFLYFLKYFLKLLIVIFKLQNK
ncbi:hypothetical protein PUN28_018021 [Cardiocondyla obscurior]|uniref:Uncharacterized protein n=1 Tax=Cardiocondyla obscurior TaxID=286306 RepID=A0AAW2EFI4_9HYME